MAVPDYQKFMLPILKIAGDRKEHSSGEVIDTVARQFRTYLKIVSAAW